MKSKKLSGFQPVKAWALRNPAQHIIRATSDVTGASQRQITGIFKIKSPPPGMGDGLCFYYEYTT